MNRPHYPAVECPECDGGVVHTVNGTLVTDIRGRSKFVGVPCDVCDATFTLEAFYGDEAVSMMADDIIRETGCIPPPR